MNELQIQLREAEDKIQIVGNRKDPDTKMYSIGGATLYTLLCVSIYCKVLFSLAQTHFGQDR